MRLATLPGDTRDGRLVVVSGGSTRAVAADKVAPSLQSALDHWAESAPGLHALSAALEHDDAAGAFAFDAASALSPLPRAWQWLDGSAFASHGELMDRAFGGVPPPPKTPLMYQGMSHQFLSGTADVRFPDEADGIDFEGEFGIITDDVPAGVSVAEAAAHIKLIVQINDWSLRALGMAEMKTGFGWVQGKPACSMAPIAISPDVLGDSWADTRVHLNLDVRWNGRPFGAAHGGAMAFGFDELIAHAARNRDLCAGTVIGSGTVSNANYREVGSSCIAEKRGIEIIDLGAPQTQFMRFGDSVRMECRAADGRTLFGAIDQKVVRR